VNARNPAMTCPPPKGVITYYLPEKKEENLYRQIKDRSASEDGDDRLLSKL
jgi:hypothetical protein